MPYNTVESARSIVGEDVSDALLIVARSLIDQRTPFRWESVETTGLFSGKGGTDKTLYLNFPVLEVLSVLADSGSGFEAQAEGKDFFVEKRIGVLTFPNGLPVGYDNISVRYRYGYDGSHPAYPVVRLAEAQIAFYLQKNPAMLSQMQLGGQSGLTVSYGKGIEEYLALVPKPKGFAASSMRRP